MKTTICKSASRRFAGIIAIAAVIGLSFVACGDNGVGGGGNGATIFTVTFNSEGGSPVSAQPVDEGSFATAPSNPTRAFTPGAGLWANPVPTEYTFNHWSAPGVTTPFDFDDTRITENITLTAQWTAPATPIAYYMEDVIVHLSDASNIGSFTLLVGVSVYAGTAWTLEENVHLTIAGIGGRRTITRRGQGQMFNLDGENRSLTLGYNITLQGYITPEGDRGNNNSMLHIAGGASLTMNPGAWITGNRTGGTNQAGGVNVVGAGSTFTMNGGKIFNNTSTVGNNGSGVRVQGGARFYMHPGAVIRNNEGTGNTTGGVLVIGTNSIFTMLGGEIHSNESTNTDSAGGVNVAINGVFRMVGGVIYGAGYANANISNPAHTNSFPVLRVVATGTAHRGTLDGNGNWDPASAVALPVDGSDIRGTGETIRVVNGVRQ